MPVAAGDRDGGFRDRPGFGEQLRFRSADGGSFRPRTLMVLLPGSVMRAALPETAPARDENRLNISETPLVGKLFPSTLAPRNAREGQLIGPVFRRGDGLVLDAREGAGADGLSSRPLVLTSHLPRLGTISYAVGGVTYTQSGGAVGIDGAPIGAAYLLDGRLVLAGEGGGPEWPSVESLFNGLLN